MARRPQTSVSGRRLRNHHSNYVNGGGVDVFGMILLGADVEDVGISSSKTGSSQVHPRDVCHPISHPGCMGDVVVKWRYVSMRECVADPD